MCLDRGAYWGLPNPCNNWQTICSCCMKGTLFNIHCCVYSFTCGDISTEAGGFSSSRYVYLEMLWTSFDADMVWCHHQMLQWNQVLPESLTVCPWKFIHRNTERSHGSAKWLCLKGHFHDYRKGMSNFGGLKLIGLKTPLRLMPF